MTKGQKAWRRNGLVRKFVRATFGSTEYFKVLEQLKRLEATQTKKEKR